MKSIRKAGHSIAVAVIHISIAVLLLSSAMQIAVDITENNIGRIALIAGAWLCGAVIWIMVVRWYWTKEVDILERMANSIQYAEKNAKREEDRADEWRELYKQTSEQLSELRRRTGQGVWGGMYEAT